MSYFDICWQAIVKSDDLLSARTKTTLLGGPGISNALQLRDEDHIYLDLSSSFPVPLIIQFHWKGPRYVADGKQVVLHEAWLSGLSPALSFKLDRRSILRVSLLGHDMRNHYKNLVYLAEIIRGT